MTNQPLPPQPQVVVLTTTKALKIVTAAATRARFAGLFF